HSGRTATTPRSSTDKARTRTNRNHDETLPPKNLQTQTQIRASRNHPLRQLHIPGLLRRSNTPRHLPRMAPRRIPRRIPRATNRNRRTPTRKGPEMSEFRERIQSIANNFYRANPKIYQLHFEITMELVQHIQYLEGRLEALEESKADDR